MALGGHGPTSLVIEAWPYLTRYRDPLPGPEPALTVTVTYGQCSGIGDGTLRQEAPLP